MKFETKTKIFQFIIFLLIFAPINFIITFFGLSFIYNLVALIAISILHYFFGPELMAYINEIEYIELEDFKEKYYYLTQIVEKYMKNRRIKNMKIGMLDDNSKKLYLFEHTFVRKILIVNRKFFEQYTVKEQKEIFNEKLLSYRADTAFFYSFWVLFCLAIVLIWIVNYLLITLFSIFGVI